MNDEKALKRKDGMTITLIPSEERYVVTLSNDDIGEGEISELKLQEVNTLEQAESIVRELAGLMPDEKIMWNR